MDITKGLKGHFCKIYGIPINLYEEPFFMDRINLLDKQYGTIKKYNKFLDSISKFETEQDYYEYYNKIKDSAISDIKEDAVFQRFNTMDMSEISSVIKKYSLPSKPIYKPSFSGKYFISIDMKQANFSALHYYDELIFRGKKTWEKYIREFTDDECIIESKYIRQRIFGSCNPNRQITYEKYLMCKLLAYLLIGIPENNIVFFSNDEIVIDDSDNKFLPFVESCVEKYTLSTNIKMKIERFLLEDLGENIGYIKSYAPMTYKLKCVDSDYIHMIIRYAEGEEIQNSDFYFYYKHTLAVFNRIPHGIIESRSLQFLHTWNARHKLEEKTQNFFDTYNHGNMTYEKIKDYARFIMGMERYNAIN